MKSTIIKIGNSRGVRLPKDVLTLSGIERDIEIRVRRGEAVDWLDRAALAGSAALALSAPACAQAFPTKPIKIVATGSRGD